MQSITAGATLDAGASMNDFVAAGVGQGAMGVKNIGSMKAYGSNTSLSQAMKAGEFEEHSLVQKDNWISRPKGTPRVDGKKTSRERWIALIGKQFGKKASVVYQKRQGSGFKIKGWLLLN